MHQPPPTVLSFAATDPSGGAGIQADILTLASMGCHPLSVVTAITVQDTVGVRNVLPVDPEWVTHQAGTILADIPVQAFKIGMPGSAGTIRAIAGILSRYPDIPVVLDPVLASGRGDPFASHEMIQAMRELLLPLTTILTPNSLEARQLAQNMNHNDSSHTRDTPELSACAAEFLVLGCKYVLITGTHEDTADVVNTLYGAEETGSQHTLIRSDKWPRLPGSFHGSGCTLASAVAALLARGLPMAESVCQAQHYTWQTLKAGFQPGIGQVIPDRMFQTRHQTDHQKINATPQD